MRRRDFILGVTPTMVVLFGLLAVPLLYTVTWSFQNVSYGSGGVWTGLDNYRQALGDPLFRQAVGFTVGLAIVNTAVLMVVGYALALLLNQARRGRAGFLGVFLVPYVLPAVIAATAFSWLFDDNFGGLANFLLGNLGFSPVQWFTDTWPNRFLVLLESVWARIPFFTLVFLAALQGVPEAQIEAAIVDGANWRQRQRHVVIPSLLPMVVFIGMITITNNLSIFDTLVALAPNAQAVGSQSVSLYVYQNAFARDQQNLGLGSAVNLMMLVVMAALISPFARRAYRDIKGD